MPNVEQLVERFRVIDTERMRGLPFYNNMLGVEAVDFQDTEFGLLGALITPWFVNVILLPVAQPASSPPLGSMVSYALPGGEQQFMVGEDETLGRYDFISLASPTLKLKTQQDAREFARARLQQLMAPQPAAAEEKPLHYVKLADKPVSRRAFLRVK